MTSRIRRGFLLVGGLFGIGLMTMAAPATARVDVDLNIFVDALSPHGDWFDYPGYGHAWRPRHVDRHWQPYTDGRWVWSDGDGWVWAENEEWGWATYHYGRWLYDDHYGWAWIPGTEWAPAWVSWRHGPDYIGWVPLPPSRFSISSYGPTRWIFVSQRQFFHPRLYDVVFAPNHRIFRECRDEYRVSHRRGRWYNGGADRHRIERIARAQAPVVRVREVDRPDRARFTRDGNRDGGELRVYRPNVREARWNRDVPTANRGDRRAHESLRGFDERRDGMQSPEGNANEGNANVRPGRNDDRRGTPQPREIDRQPRGRDLEPQREASKPPQTPQPAPRVRDDDRRQTLEPAQQPQQQRTRGREDDRRGPARTAAPTRVAPPVQPAERVRDRDHGQRPARVAADQPKAAAAAPQQQPRDRKERGAPQRTHKPGPGEPGYQVPAVPVQPGGPNRR